MHLECNVSSNRVRRSAPLFSLLLLAACGAEVDPRATEDEPVGVQEQALYTAGGDWTYSTHDIGVCFVVASDADGSTDNSQNDTIRTWIEESYGRVTDLRFHGWGDCPPGCDVYEKAGHGIKVDHDPTGANCPSTTIVLRIDTSGAGQSGDYSNS